MREQNRKHGRKSSGRKHGGKDMKRARKGRTAPKSGGSKAVEGLTLIERERRALAEADPFRPAPPVASPGVVVAASEPPREGSAEIEAFRKAVGVGPFMTRGRLAVIAFVMAAMGGVALVRACEPKGAPIEDDAADNDSCSDDASLCVARA
jgi:hypothetical protein